MNRIILNFTFLTLLLASCSERKNIIPDASLIQDTTYIINGITDITIRSLDSAEIEMNTVFQKGIQERVTLSIEGLPNRAKASFQPATGIPGFNTKLKLKTNVTDPGTYTIEIKGTSASGLIKSYQFNLTVLDDFVCDTFLAMRVGNYTTYKVGTPDSLYGFTRLTWGTSLPKTYWIWHMYLGTYNGYTITTSNLTSAYDYSKVITYQFDCDKKIILIPEKTITVPVYSNNSSTDEDFTVYGNGIINFDASTVQINYTVKDYLGNANEYVMIARFKL